MPLSPIETAITRSNFKQAIELLLALNEEKSAPFRGDILGLQTQIDELSKKRRLGIISFDEENRMRNKIVYNLLETYGSIKDFQVIDKTPIPINSPIVEEQIVTKDTSRRPTVTPTTTPPNLGTMNKHNYEHGYALFIGIRYGHWTNIRPLNGTLKDVDALSQHFTDLQKAAFKPENVIVLKEEAATKIAIEQALKDLANKTKKDPDASVIVHYSGHGETDGNNFFLVPYDFDNSNEWRYRRKVNPDTAIFSKDFAKKIAAINAKKCLVILDCCHSEGMPVERGIADSPLFLKGFMEELDATLDANLPTVRGLTEEINKGSGRVILTSCQAEEKALDLGYNGLFTKILLECLNGNNNIEKDGWVRLIDMMRYIPKTVATEAATYSNHQQNPMFKRIENLSSEDFIVCAYNMAQVRGLSSPATSLNVNHPISTPITPLIEKETLFDKIDDNELDEVFELLEEHRVIFRGFQDFRDEYTYDGLKGLDYRQFKKRLKTFINGKLRKK